MTKKHGWSEDRAKAARGNFKLNKARALKPDGIRKTKICKRRTVRYQCPIHHCLKEVTRLDNHLRQTHKISSDKKIKRCFQVANKLAPIEEPSSSEEEMGSSSEEEGTTEYIPFFTRFRDNEIDPDYTPPNSTKASLSSSQHRVANCVERECVSEVDHESDIDDGDEEDEDDRFFLSSEKEDEVMYSFVEHLQSIDGGLKPERCANAHKRVVMTILRHDGENIQFEKLTKRDFLVNWIDNFEGKPGTIKTYLCSLQHFFNFALTKRTDILGKKNIKDVEILIRQWKRNLWRRVQKDKHEKDLSDIKNMPTTELLLQFDRSEHLAHAAKLLKQSLARKDSPQVKRDFCMARDYLISSLILDNSTRPGVLSNLTLKEFGEAQKQDEGWLISVYRHKTDYMGPALISVTSELHEDMEAYLLWRNKLSGIGKRHEDLFFVSWNGNRMTSSMVATQFRKFWNYALNITGPINSTLVRKFTTTTVHQKFPHLKKQTADLLCHSQKTAEQHYALYEKSKTTVATSQKLREALRSTHIGEGNVLFLCSQEKLQWKS